MANANEGPMDVNNQTSLFDFVKAFITYIGGPTILLYPAGFLVFLVQIGFYYPFDFWTAWYVTSLVPPSVVVGQGMKISLWPLLSAVIAYVFGRWLVVGRQGKYGDRFRSKYGNTDRLVSTGVTHQRIGDGDNRPRRREILRQQIGNLVDSWSGIVRRPRLMVLAIVSVVFSVPLLIILFLSIPEAERSRVIDWPLFVPPTVLFGLIGGWLITYDYKMKYTTPGDRSHFGLLKGATEGWIFSGLLVAYAGAVISALITMIPFYLPSQQLDLPRVKMTLLDTAAVKALDEGTTIENALLLNHSNGYWHVINVSSRGRTPAIGQQSLFMIPDGDVKDVTIYESPLDMADLALEVSLSDSAWANKDLKYAWANKKSLEYTAKVSNAGPDAATGVELTIKLPPNFSAGEELPPQCDKADNNSLKCNLGRLNPGASSPDLTFSGSPEAGALPQTPTFSVNAAEPDLDPEGDIVPDVALWVAASTVGKDTSEPEWYKPDTWANKEVTIDLTVDENGDSGAKRIFYSASGDQNIAKKTVLNGSAKLDITSPGTTTVTYSVGDGASDEKKKDSLIVKLDKTKPKVRCDRPDGTWHKDDVSISCEASDSLSGLANADDNSFSLTTSVADGTQTDNAQTNNKEIVDKADNYTTAGPVDAIKVDKQAPEVTIDSGPKGLIKEDSATFRFSADEAGLSSGAPVMFECRRMNDGPADQFVACRSPQTYDDLSDGPHTFYVRPQDRAGNVGDIRHLSFTIDTLAPKLKLPGDLVKEATSKDGAEVTFDATATDKHPAEPKVTCSPASSQEFHLGETTVSCSATDEAGNKATGSFKVEVRDTTPPTIDGVPSDITKEATGQDGARVSWDVPNATDIVDGDVSVKCSSDSGLSSNETFPIGETTVSCSATDEAGNKTSKSFKATVQDTTPPVISGIPSSITQKATGADGSKASWQAPTAKDTVDGGVSVSCDPSSGATFAVGQTTVKCTASDDHDNTKEKSFEVRVIYGFDRFLYLIEGDHSTLNAVKAGDAVIIGFALEGDRGTHIFAEGYPSSHEIDCASRRVVPIEPSNLRYSSGVGHYTYAWNTEETWSGCRQLVLKLKDGTQHSANFKFIE